MSPIQPLADALRRLPKKARATLYSVWAVIGAVLAVCEFYGVAELGPVSLDQALQGYLFLSPLFGGVAVANTKEAEPEPEVPEPEEDFDLSSFQPIDDNDDVFV